MKEWRGEAVKQRMGEGVLPFTPSFLHRFTPSLSLIISPFTH